MTTAALSSDLPAGQLDDATYRRRIRAWVLYDWANSAFATTILAAFLPVYYSTVAGATLPSEATATAYWSLTLSLSIFIVAILSPILGTISDIQRSKKRYLSIFVLIGVIGTGLLVLVNTGDWLLASLFFVFGRIGFAGANVFYDSLLPHVAREEDRDTISARGFALGYFGGGLLLAINVVMFTLVPDSLFENAGVRLSFLSVAIWWALFSLPILRQVPEPPAATATLAAGETLVGASFKRLRQTFRDLRQYRELFKYLIAFLVFSDPINTIIGLAAIYGAELGFGTIELVLALLLVQFVGVPFTLIFGRLPSAEATRRPIYLAYILFNMVMLPVVAIVGAQVLPANITGQQPAPYVTDGDFVGEGVYTVAGDALALDDGWQMVTVTGDEQVPEGFLGSLTTALTGTPPDEIYAISENTGDQLALAINGAQVRLTYRTGPDGGVLSVLADGAPVLNDDDEPLRIDTFSETPRYNVRTTLDLPQAGPQTLTLVHEANGDAGTVAITSAEVLPPVRENSLPAVIGALLALQAVGIAFALVFGRFFKGLAATLDTRRSLLLAILLYCVIAVWGFILNSTLEFWFLAWMVAIVQGGSQALSRSLYAKLSPASKSGEFFGLFSILSKGASVVGSGLFAGAALIFGSSRPAILSLIILFVLGAYLLTRVDIEAGIAAARAEDAAILGADAVT